MSIRTASQYLVYGKPVAGRLPVAGSGRRKRAVRSSIRFGRHELTISCRRFTTPPHRRSRRFNQVVVTTPLFSFKETAISIRSKARKRRSHAKLLAASILVLASLVNAGYFATHLKTRPDLSLPAKAASAAAPAQVTPKALSLDPQIRQHEKLALLKPAVVAPAKPQLKPAPPAPRVMARSIPLSISIPSIRLSASVFQEGLGADGAISMPDVFDQVGWYDKSPTPGELGPAVLTGHVDSTEGIAVFWRLRELKAGDIIRVGRQNGTTAAFRVTKLDQFPQDKFPTRAVYGPISYAGIRLVTCGGTFNTATGHYDQNTVVYGRLIE